MTTIYLNGKFTAQRTTGVQRVAAQLVQALDAQDDGRRVLLCPPGAALPRLRRIEARAVGWPGLPLHVWEQLVLPFASRGGLLVNLAGAAPAFARRQLCLLHDAAVFDHPEAYTRAFVLWYRWLFRRLAARAGLMTVSAFSRERLAQHLGVRPAGIAVVPNGADHLNAVVPDAGVLQRWGLQPARYLLAVASANPTKNLPALIDAFGRLVSDPVLRLVIVGSGNARVFADTIAADTNAADPPGVLRTGPLHDAELKALYAGAVAFVFPSLYEGFGLPPLEAMACGCPVAAARAAAIPEVCGDAALYFDPRSVDAIAAALRRLLDDAPLRAQLREAGHQRVAGFRWQASAAALQAAMSTEAGR